MSETHESEYCEICGYLLPEDAIEPCSCESRQDSVFWTNEAGHEVVWARFGEVAYQVVRNGEMRVIYTDPKGEQHTLRYTDDFDALGITTDEILAEWNKKDHEVWTWVNNSWFEVWEANDGAIQVEEFYSEPIDTLDEAIQYALDLHEDYKKGLGK